MADEPRATGVVETALYVAHLDRAAAFYRDLFGLAVEIRDEFICVLRVPGGQALILFPTTVAAQPDRTSSPAGAVDGVIPPHGGAGRLHFAFGVPAADLAGWEGRLAERGVAVEGRVRWNRGGRSVYFRDPDGHLVELITPGLWTFY